VLGVRRRPGVIGGRPRAWASLVMLGLLATSLSPSAAGAGQATTRIEVLSGRPDLISGGEALVAVDLPAGANPAGVRMSVSGRDVTNEFAVRPNGRYEGLVTGLPDSPSVLMARLADGSGARLTVTSHPIGGPVLSGPQVVPWVCQAGAADAQCDMPRTHAFMYMPVGGNGMPGSPSGLQANANPFQPYDPKHPPPSALIARTTTDEGVTVPYIIRVETGYQDRDQYQVAVLFDPDSPWAPWAPQKQWNHKVVVTHGASCGADHTIGTAPSVTDDVALGRGFAVMSTALDNAGHNCNVVTEAESLMMAKEHLIDSYGTIRYTIGTGCSGGSLVQQQVANAYPGVYQGILPQCSFPDAWSTGQQLADYELDRRYLENPGLWGAGVAWTPLQIAAVEGHPNHANAVELSTLYFNALGDPAYACNGVSSSERYNARTNPHGVRCDLQDYMVNVLGRRPGDGFAGRPLDNVGVQYGLDALLSGQITPDQFVDLNAKIGGFDIDANWQAARVVADQPALANAYRSGAINEANNLGDVAIIDLRGPDPGAFHDVYRAFAIRARLDRQNGTHANQVIWEGAAPVIGDVGYTTTGLLAVDRWLSAVERDHRAIPQARKIIDDKPGDVRDQCSDGLGQVVPGQVCQAVVQAYATPRMVAGESIATDVNKCRLEPLTRSAYRGVQFTDGQWGLLRRAFPTGVCDWSQPGVSQAPTVPWLTYQGHSGGQPLGPPPGSVAVAR
jgi:Tannase-like family of unknown function (DUF6351)